MVSERSSLRLRESAGSRVNFAAMAIVGLELSIEVPVQINSRAKVIRASEKRLIESQSPYVTNHYLFFRQSRFQVQVYT